MEGICAAVGVREPTPSRRSATLMERVRGSGGLLIVDEAQHLSSGALDQLRTIHDLTKIGVAVAGNSEVFARIDGDGRKGLFAQFRSRIGMRLTRGKPLAADVEAMLDASGVTGAGERRLLRVVANKPGALRGVSKTLRVAHILAAGEGVPMTEAHLRAAAERLSHDGLNTEGV
jgi:DNA transposition AAA+ family ATPase